MYRGPLWLALCSAETAVGTGPRIGVKLGGAKRIADSIRAMRRVSESVIVGRMGWKGDSLRMSLVDLLEEIG